MGTNKAKTTKNHESIVKAAAVQKVFDETK
jgi:hypothetical protein